MKVKIHELAVKEFDEAIEWYENQSNGLGKRFKKTVTDQINKIKKNPNWFLIEHDNIVIWAIAHMHRIPWYWQSRLNI